VSEAVVIAGANGAGKTTFARELLPALYPEVEFLNVDEVQTEGSIFAHLVAAGREVLRRLGDAERRRDSFAIETTLSSTMYVRRMRSWKTWDIAWSSITSSCPPMTTPCDVSRRASRLAGTRYPNRT
jgi:predicted ABC-type ATPase